MGAGTAQTLAPGTQDPELATFLGHGSAGSHASHMTRPAMAIVTVS